MADTTPDWAKKDAPTWATERIKTVEEPTLGQEAKAFGKSALESTPGALGAYGGAEAGAALGSMLGPVGTVVGGLGGGLAGYLGGEYLGEKAGKAIPKPVKKATGFTPEQRAQEKHQMPIASTAGALAPDVAAAAPGLIGLGKGAVDIAAKTLLGTPSRTSEYVAKTAEKLGFKLSPSQVRADVPSLPAKGAVGYAEENQNLANQLATKGTGRTTSAGKLDDNFIRERLSTLGKEYNDIYKGKSFQIDQPAIDVLREISAKEAAAGPATVSPVKQTADNMLKAYDQLTSRPGAIPDTFSINGEDLQRLRNALTERARSTSAGNAREIYNLVDQIDASVARHHPEVAKKLDVLRPKYRNAIILEDLYKQGGIKQGNISLEKLGNMMLKDRGAVRRTPGDIDDLAKIGRELKLRAAWEEAGKTAISPSGLGKLTGTAQDLASTLARTKTARAIQRSRAPKYLSGG